MTCGEKLVFLLPNRVCRGIKGEVKSVAIIQSDVLYILWKGNRTRGSLVFCDWLGSTSSHLVGAQWPRPEELNRCSRLVELFTAKELEKMAQFFFWQNVQN